MRERIILAVIVGVLVFVMITRPEPYETEYQFTYTFEESQEGWMTGYADYPKDFDPEIYEMHAGYGTLPSGINSSGVSLTGHNRSDDLFMYLTKLVEGLKPDTTYNVSYSLEIATNTPFGLGGIGGSPGESVYVKVGAVDQMPDLVEDTSDLMIMNLDKGNQASEGPDMINIGTLANPNIDIEDWDETVYAIMSLDNLENPFTVTTDSDGSLWVIVGTDSGFEGKTTVYYDTIDITFTESD